eukprot:NODE_129_length_16972_cov_2.172643.p9 type:complete len:283 gc:universal NODE_129_length_16972_cov_2.172643:8815-7967(-)
MLLCFLTLFSFSQNKALSKAFYHSINIDRTIKNSIGDSKVFRWRIKGNGYRFTSAEKKCKNECLLSVETKLKLSPKYQCKVFFSFKISTGKDSIDQGDTYSNCVIVNEIASPMKIGYPDSSVKSVEEIKKDYSEVTKDNDKTAIKHYMGFWMRLNTNFARFKFEKAFEAQANSSGVDFQVGQLICVEGATEVACAASFTESPSKKVLVLKYLPTFLSSSILYVVVEKDHRSGYLFKQFYIKPNYYEKKRKTYVSQTSCKKAVTCFAKLSVGFKNLLSFTEME